MAPRTLADRINARFGRPYPFSDLLAALGVIVVLTLLAGVLCSLPNP